MDDPFRFAGREFSSRLIMGTSIGITDLAPCKWESAVNVRWTTSSRWGG